MKNIKVFIALILIPSFVCLAMSSFFSAVFAASYPVNIRVESYESDDLTLEWDFLTGTQSIEVNWHSPDIDGLPVFNNEIINLTASSIILENLQSDYIYDIDIKIYNDVDAGGSEIGHGFIYFLPDMSFYASRHVQERYELSGGGYEIGVDPSLNLKWKMPVVFNGTDYAYAADTLEYMENIITGVYEDGRELDVMDFRVNISSDSSKINGGSSQASIIAEYDAGAGEYNVHVSGDESITATVYGIDAQGYLNFDLIGRKDIQSDPPEPENQYQLKDWDLLPGTVFYMNIKPVFRNSAGNAVNAISVGDPSGQNGSYLSGPFSYTYTPLRFQISRDSFDNIYVKIYKLNQGSLDLPRLYYQVQTSDDPSIPGDWTVKKTLDDTYFTGEYAVTVLTGISPNNEIFYKIVVKSDAYSDRLESSQMPYILTEDTGRPPVPRNVIISERKANVGQVEHPQTHQIYDIRSTDVTFSWEKPLDWTDIKDNLYYHFVLSTSQQELEDEQPLFFGDEIWGRYQSRYRLVKYCSAISPNMTENASSLSYTLNGFELFSWEDETGTSFDINNPEQYPDFLLPNTIYYLQVYSTREIDRGSQDPEVISERSLTISFTTLPQEERDVPLPVSFSVYSNEINMSGESVIKLQFEGLNESGLDWSYYTINPDEDDSIYYDLYMSSRSNPESFLKIGTTELAGDINFTSDEIGDKRYITAQIKNFSVGSEAYDAFGAELRKNTSYYFTLKTRLVMANEPEDRESVFTAILPVTTIRGEINDPDESSRKPLAPTDFGVSLDAEGNPIISGSKVVLNWSELETDSSYRLICTSQRIASDAQESEYSDDLVYQSFISEFGSRDSDGNDLYFTLNPQEDLSSGFFEYNAVSKKFTLNIEDWIFPNRLYFFSLQSVKNENASQWICIPVTTSLIDMPESLSPVNSVQIGFQWTDAQQGLMADDFRVYIKKTNEELWQVQNQSQCTIVKEGNIYYGRLNNIEGSSAYDIRVSKGEEYDIPVYSSNIVTRDVFHQIMVKWKGQYSDQFELAIRGENEKNYTDLENEDLEIYSEENSFTIGNDSRVFYALIKTIPYRNENQEIVRNPLKSNTKYFIKVRSKKTDPVDPMIISLSKYTPSVYTRTEFNQEDYDMEDENTKKEAIFLDGIEGMEDGLYWRVDVNKANETVVLLKGDRIVNMLRMSGRKSITVDIEDITKGVGSCIYIPVSIINELNERGRTLELRLDGVEYLVRPGSISLTNGVINDVLMNEGSRDAYIVWETSRVQTFSNPEGKTKISDVYRLKTEILGFSIIDSDLGQSIHEKLYDTEEGLVNEKLGSEIKSYNGPSSTDEYSKFVMGVIELIKNELSIYIRQELDLHGSKSSTSSIKLFKVPLSTAISCSLVKGRKEPFILPEDSSMWIENDKNVIDNGNCLIFDNSSTGLFAVFTAENSIRSISESNPAYIYFEKLGTFYNMENIFKGYNNNPDPERDVTDEEMQLLFEEVTRKPFSTLNRTGIDKYVSRQQSADFYLDAYCTLTGLNVERIVTFRPVFIKDENDVDNVYYKAVIFVIDNKIMELKSGSFYPKDRITRSDAVKSMVKIIELAGIE